MELLSAFAELLPLVELFNEQTAPKTAQVPKANRDRQRQDRDTAPKMKKQIESLRSAVTAKGSEDFVAEVGDMRVILTAKREFFIDPSMNDTIDGTFRVFGKATRVISTNTEKISLLRRTALGKFENITENFAPMMESMQKSGFSGPVETEISGPTMQVIPIAIFS